MTDDETESWIKLLLTGAVIVIGSPSLPLTGGASATVIIGVIMAIWGIDWSGN